MEIKKSVLNQDGDNFTAGQPVRLQLSRQASGIDNPENGIGIVTRTPVAESDSYHVYLSNGQVCKADINQLEFLNEDWDKIHHRYPALFHFKSNIIRETVVGSRLYGLESAQSDTDIRGIYIQPFTASLTPCSAPEQFEDYLSQTCHWELDKYIQLALKGNPTILECLFAEKALSQNELGEELFQIRRQFLSKRMQSTFLKYAQSQLYKLNRRKENNLPVNWKHAMHMIRLLKTGIRIANDCSMNLDMSDNKDLLLSIRNGHMDMAELLELEANLSDELIQSFRRSALPDFPDESNIIRHVVALKSSFFNL